MHLNQQDPIVLQCDRCPQLLCILVLMSADIYVQLIPHMLKSISCVLREALKKTVDIMNLALFPFLPSWIVKKVIQVRHPTSSSAKLPNSLYPLLFSFFERLPKLWSFYLSCKLICTGHTLRVQLSWQRAVYSFTCSHFLLGTDLFIQFGHSATNLAVTAKWSLATKSCWKCINRKNLHSEIPSGGQNSNQNSSSQGLVLRLDICSEAFLHYQLLSVGLKLWISWMCCRHNI